MLRGFKNIMKNKKEPVGFLKDGSGDWSSRRLTLIVSVVLFPALCVAYLILHPEGSRAYEFVIIIDAILIGLALGAITVENVEGMVTAFLSR